MTHKAAMTSDFLFIPCGGKFEKLWLASIIYCRAMNETVEVITREGTVITEATMSQLLKSLPAHLFCQVHRSYTVSLDHILYFDDREIHMPGVILPVEEKYRTTLKNKITILSASIVCQEYSKKRFYIDENGNLKAG